MKKKLFECIGDNTFRLVNPQSMGMMETSTGYQEPIATGEDQTGDISGTIDDLLMQFDPENPDPDVFEKLERIRSGIMNKINNAQSVVERDNWKDLYGAALRKLSVLG